MCSSFKKQFVNLPTLVTHDGRYMIPGQSLKPPFTMYKDVQNNIMISTKGFGFMGQFVKVLTLGCMELIT